MSSPAADICPTCPTCHGSGWVETSFTDGIYPITAEIQCPDCGAGDEPAFLPGVDDQSDLGVDMRLGR